MAIEEFTMQDPYSIEDDIKNFTQSGGAAAKPTTSPWVAGMNAPQVAPPTPNPRFPSYYAPGGPYIPPLPSVSSLNLPAVPLGLDFSFLGKVKDAWRVLSKVGNKVPLFNKLNPLFKLLTVGAGGYSAYEGIKSAAGHVNDASPVVSDSVLDYTQTLKNSYSFPSVVRSSANMDAPMPTNVNFLGKNYNLSYDSKNNIFTFDTEYGKMYIDPDTGIGSFTSPIVE